MRLFYPLAFFIFAIDQAAKFFADKYILKNQSLPVVQDIFHFTLVHNQGAAFGILRCYGNLLLVIGIVVIALVVYFRYRVPAKNYMVQTALGFILGGSLGNIVDRIRFGYVVDFFDFRFWPVFNFADMFINIGVAILVVYLIRGEKNVPNSN